MSEAKPRIPDVVEAFARYYRKNPAWGSLHAILDDGNLHDSDVAFCAELAAEEGDHEGAELAAILARMSRTQRRKVGRIAERISGQ